MTVYPNKHKSHLLSAPCRLLFLLCWNGTIVQAGRVGLDIVVVENLRVPAI